MSGPVIGSILYKHLKFSNTFLVFSGLMLACGFLVLIFLPKRLNFSKDPYEELQKELRASELERGRKIPSFIIFFKNVRSVVTIASATIAMIFMLFFNAILSEHLKNHFGLETDECGYVMALGALFYAVTSPLVGVIFKGIPRRYVT